MRYKVAVEHNEIEGFYVVPGQAKQKEKCSAEVLHKNNGILYGKFRVRYLN